MASHHRIATVTLNPAIDQTAQARNLRPGRVNRVTSERSDAGGKGVYAAAFLARHGHALTVTGLLGRANVEPFEALFAERKIEDRFIRVPGRTRVNVKLVDPICELVTDINFTGIEATPDHVAEVMAVIEALAGEGVRWFVLSGSLPAGVDSGIYREMTESLKAKGCKIVLDGSGLPFNEALQAGPHVIRPNVDELQEIVGKPLSEHGDIVRAARGLFTEDAELALVTLREHGALFITAERAVLAEPPRVRIASTVGAADAMIAGITHGLLTDMDLTDLARLAMALSLGALGQLGPNLPPDEDIAAFAELVEVRELS